MADKIEIPLPEDVKWEAVGRGYASVLMEKQARIDRLERLICMLYDNICKGINPTVLQDDDLETRLCTDILKDVHDIRANLETESRRVAQITAALSYAEDTIRKLKQKGK